jgi:endonuclease YncB( thermonuclease family)
MFIGRVAGVTNEGAFELRQHTGGTVTIRPHGVDAPETYQSCACPPRRLYGA